MSKADGPAPTAALLWQTWERVGTLIGAACQLPAPGFGLFSLPVTSVRVQVFAAAAPRNETNDRNSVRFRSNWKGSRIEIPGAKLF
jgi:hypothetical protein